MRRTGGVCVCVCPQKLNKNRESGLTCTAPSSFQPKFATWHAASQLVILPGGRAISPARMPNGGDKQGVQINLRINTETRCPWPLASTLSGHTGTSSGLLSAQPPHCPRAHISSSQPHPPWRPPLPSHKERRPPPTCRRAHTPTARSASPTPCSPAWAALGSCPRRSRRRT